MVEIDEGVGRPELLLQLLPGDHIAGTLQQHGQNLEGLLLEFDPQPVPAQLAGVQVGLKGAEADHLR